jgi:predicted nucleic acid-binding Zn ribbon protein
VTSITAGGYHTCAIKTDDTPVCWGNNELGQTTIPAGTGPVTSITAGYSHSCAVKTEGTPVCWGDDTYGQTTIPDGTGTVGPVPPAVIDRPTVSLTDGVVTAEHGTWSNDPDTYSYAFQRCAGSPQVCTPITGTTDADDGDSTYTLTGADDGTRTRVKVTATNEAGSDNALSQTVAPPKPVSTSKPTITGTPKLGETLTADHGGWNNNPTYSYTWQRCTGSPAVCATITGTTDADDGDTTYTLTQDDVANRVRVKVTATNPSGTATAVSGVTTIVTAKPVNTVRPTITSPGLGVHSTLTAHPGEWDNNPTYTYTWQRCTGTPTICTTIAGSPTTDTYRIVQADVSKRIRVIVTATNPTGKATAASAQTGKINA